MFDAYTLRKIIPRLVTAAILISISWPLLSFFVQLSNSLGFGVTYLIENPFNQLSDMLKLGGGPGAITTLLAGGAIASLGIVGLLSFVATAAIAIFIAYITLIIRQILVIGLIVISPLAIIAYVLPNTEKLFKLWRSSFTGVLVAFPIISMFIATGRVFSAISSQNENAVSQVIAFTAYFAPYFMLPLAFKMSGGVIGSVAGTVNSRGAGFKKAVSGYRNKKLNENVNKMKNFSRVSDKSGLGRAINTSLGGAFNPKSLRSRNTLNAARNNGLVNQGQAALKNDPTAEANKNDDNFLLALANPELAAKKLKEATNPAERIARQRGIDNANLVKSKNSNSTKLAAFNNLASTGYQFSSGTQGYEELRQTARSIVGNDEAAMSGVMDTAQFLLKNAGRGDLAGINHNAGESKDIDSIKEGLRKQGNYGRGQSKVQTYHGGARAWLGSGTVDPRSGKTFQDSESIATGIRNGIANGTTNYNDVAEYHSMLIKDYDSATDGNKLEIMKQIQAIEAVANPIPAAIDPNLPPPLIVNADKTQTVANNDAVNFKRNIANNKAAMRQTGFNPAEHDKH